MRCDVAIIGAGAAGIAAAVAAAESGLQVVLIERYGFVGGLATAALVGTICGLYYRDEHTCRYAVQGFACLFADAVGKQSNTKPAMFGQGLHFLPYQPRVFHEQAVQRLNKAGVQLYLHLFVSAVSVEDKRITALKLISEHEILTLHAKAVVDCSGHACISTLADLETIKEQNYQAGAFVFQVAGLPDMPERVLALNLLRWIKRGIYNSALDTHCERLSIVPGTVNKGIGLLKLGMPEPFNAQPGSMTKYELSARTRCQAIVDYLQVQEVLLKNLTITAMPTQIGVRSGLRPVGIELLQTKAILSCIKPAHGVAIGAWPIELWGQQRQANMTYFKANDYYLIPAGCLVSRHINNLFFAGRAISATETAIASARVIGTCLGTGYAAGMLAAEYVLSGQWHNAITKIRALQVCATGDERVNL